jgi:hypothetical protein
VVVAAVILGGIGYLSTRKQADAADADRMRQVYVALSLYEAGFDGVPAPSLAGIGGYLLNPGNLVSDRDPYAKANASAFPDDAGRLQGPRRSPQRISYSYLWSFPESVKRAGRHGFSVQKDPLMGILANEWAGEAKATGDFNAEVSGPVLRIALDGSLYKTSDRGGPKPLGNYEDLFFRR